MQEESKQSPQLSRKENPSVTRWWPPSRQGGFYGDLKAEAEMSCSRSVGQVQKHGDGDVGTGEAGSGRYCRCQPFHGYELSPGSHRTT